MIAKIHLSNIPSILPINKENHQALVPICKHVLAEPLVSTVYLHNNTIYCELLDTRFTYSDAVMVSISLGMTLGCQLHKVYKMEVNTDLSIIPSQAGNFKPWDQIFQDETANAELVYEEYVEELITNPTKDLFGITAITPFDQLPDYFKNGDLFTKTDIEKRDTIRNAWQVAAGLSIQKSIK